MSEIIDWINANLSTTNIVDSHYLIGKALALYQSVVDLDSLIGTALAMYANFPSSNANLEHSYSWFEEKIQVPLTYPNSLVCFEKEL